MKPRYGLGEVVDGRIQLIAMYETLDAADMGGQVVIAQSLQRFVCIVELPTMNLIAMLRSKQSKAGVQS